MAAPLRDGRPLFMKMAALRSLLLGLCILHCIARIEGCRVFEHPLGTVTDDQELEVGSPLSFRCTLFDSTAATQNISSSDVVLKRQRTPLRAHTLDAHTAEYAVPSATPEDSGFYNCFVPHRNYTSPQLVCSSYIAVGFKPLDVQNFSCISLGYSNLTCSWDAPSNPVPTTYTLSDFLFDNEILRRQCPVQLSSGCQYRLDTKPAYIQTQNYLNFIVSGNNSLGKSKQYFRIRHSEIIKPAVPSATTEDVSETSLYLRLGAPRGLQNGEFSGGLIYSVKYYSVSTKLDVTQDVSVEAETNTRLKISDLVPHTQYRFEVRCRLNFPGDNFYWSDTYNATEMTLPDVPYLAPVIDKSAFDVQVIAGNRTITLYWKAVPSEFENGNDFHYIIKYHEHYVRTKRRASGDSGSWVRVENRTSHSFPDMDVGTAYMFKVVAANRLGNSSNETAVIVVDKAEKFLPHPKDVTVISYGRGTYDVSWRAPDASPSDFTLFWCETLVSRPAKCDGPLDWSPVAGTTDRRMFLPSNLTNYQFAVATVTDRRTSGMLWAPCTVMHGVPYKIPKIELFPKNSTSLRVRWSLKCEAEKKVIREYAVYYCPYDGKCVYENARNCKVNGSGAVEWPFRAVTNTSLTEYALGPLIPFTCYFSYVRVRTDAGWGENSDFAAEVTMSAAPGGPPTAVSAVPLPPPSEGGGAASVLVSFHPPSVPNGVITRYRVLYNRTRTEGATFHREVRGNEVTLDKLFFHSNYSVEVEACVDQACSPRSPPVYVYTGISRPGIVGLPRVEILGGYVNVTWDPPVVPNGPLSFYQVRVGSSNDTDMEEVTNVTGRTFLNLSRECSRLEEMDSLYTFRVRAVNLREGLPLYGDYSGPATTVICPSGGLFAGFNTGVIVGVVLGSIFVLVALFYFARYFLRNINEAKKTKIKLPKGLESPLDVNPLSSYDKFKSGLQNSRDAGIPNDRAYDRLFSSSSEGDLKDKVSKRVHAGRNPSGESKAPDSLSSANTTKTHNSLDSGAEVESPPSPDSLSSSPRTPSKHRVSRDSGLARDDSRPLDVTNFAMTAKGRCFEPEDGSEPLVLHPYAKYGEPRGAEEGYSKYGPDPTLPNHHHQVFSAITVVPCRKKDPPAEAYSKFGEARPGGYVSVNDVMSSAKGTAARDDPKEARSAKAADSKKAGETTGYVPVEISYPEVGEVVGPESTDCDADLGEVLPPGFAVATDAEKSASADGEETDGAVPDGPCEAIVTNNLFHGGGRVFLGGPGARNGDSEPEDWCELGTVRVDPEAYCDSPVANGFGSESSGESAADPAEGAVVVLTEQPLANGYSPFAPLIGESNMSPPYVLVKQNVSNVPVESV